MRTQLPCTGGALCITVGALRIDDAILCTEIFFIHVHKSLIFFSIYMIIF